jgi:DNA-binding transcriptional ArsR family regulator
MNQLSELTAELFKALSHPVRIKILYTLRNHTELSVNDLKEYLGLEAANVSQQLAVLRSKKLVKTRKEANNVYYSVQDDTIFNLLDASKVLFNNQLSGMQQFLGDTAQLLLVFVMVNLIEKFYPLYLELQTSLVEVKRLLC